jgi:hypothetical protein
MEEPMTYATLAKMPARVRRILPGHRFHRSLDSIAGFTKTPKEHATADTFIVDQPVLVDEKMGYHAATLLDGKTVYIHRYEWEWADNPTASTDPITLTKGEMLAILHALESITNLAVQFGPHDIDEWVQYQRAIAAKNTLQAKVK